MITTTMPAHVAPSQFTCDQGFPVLEIELYRPHPEKEGYLQSVGNITIREFGKAINWFLETRGHTERLDYYGLYAEVKNAPLPNHRWISVFAVTGGSEGYYIHVELIEGGARTLIYLAKSFESMAFCYEVCADLARFLGV